MYCLLPLLIAVTAAASPQQPPSTQHAVPPVLVELFTSEGCSDCPPADDLLNTMTQRTPADVDVIPMAFHVTYWDTAEWRDRFSNTRFTERQKEYQVQLHTNDLYTPQSIIDGRYQAVGSDASQIFALIRRAEAEPKPVTVELSVSGDSLNVSARAADGSPTGRVLLAITEDGLSTDVKGGENRSRTLRHAAVVRSLEDLGKFNDGAFSHAIRLRLKSDWRRDKMHAVVFVQDKNDHVLGAATTPLSTP